MRLFISNLNNFTTKPQIIALLDPFGLVKSVEIITNVQSGCSECAALVEMELNDGLMAISQLNDLRFMNHYIKVEETLSGIVSR